MDYGYKITTHGRRLLAACLDLGAPLKLTRAAVGSGMIDEDADLAKAHGLIQYEAEASITDWRHEADWLFLTIQYSNQDRPAAGTFTLSEFMVWAENPETGQKTDLLYATLGDFRQPVPGYRPGLPVSTWSYPLVLVVSSELQVFITGSPGLATSKDLREAIDRLTLAIMTNELMLPLTTDAGEPLLTDAGTPILAVYHPNQISSVLMDLAALDGRLSGQIGQAAADCTAQTSSARLYAVSAAQAYTDGRIAVLQRQMEADAGSVAGQIAQAKLEAVSTAETKIAAAKQEAIAAAGSAADVKISSHNTAPAAHPAHLAAVSNS